MGRINTAIKKTAEEQEINFVPFMFHDLKWKGISDSESDKLKASGHRNASMLKIYGVKLNTVKPAGK